MTRVFVDAFVGLQHRHRGAPGPRPGRRVVDRELVEQRLRAGAREALDEMHVFVGAARLTEERQRGDALGFEVRRLDDECVLLPSAARDARVAADRRPGRRRIVQGHDPRVVDHLGVNHDVIARLEQLEDVALVAGNNRRAGAPAKDAAVRQPGILRTIRPLELRRTLGLPRLRPWGGLGELSIPRVGDERGALRPIRLRQDVVEHLATVAGRLPALALPPPGRHLLSIPGFLRRGERFLAGEFVGTLERHLGGIVPDPLQVRLSVRCPRHGPGIRLVRPRRGRLTADHLRQRRDHQRHHREGPLPCRDSRP